MPAPLLVTKLSPPPPRPDLVPRPRLLARLDQGLAGKLTLVAAPAGFGKTTLLSHWLGRVGRPAAWLALEEGDADPARFLRYLAGALERVAPGLEQPARETLRLAQQPAFETLIALVVNHVAALPAPAILVLDDYHSIDRPEVHDLLGALLEHLPPSLHLVLLTREDPPLPLARLRVRGQLNELRAEELKFSAEEAARFLRECMGLDLAPDDVAALEARSEGWIAGLQLVGLSLQSRRDRRAVIDGFRGNQRHVLDYLAREVLAQQPEDAQAFMLQTAILDRLCGELCDAVTGQSEGQLTLEIMEAGNLFLVSLDEYRRWYRYHHLYRDFLREQLRRCWPERVSTLHRRASAWYERHGYPTEALEHLLAGQDYARAAELVERLAEELWTSAQIPLLLDWLGRLPIATIRDRPYLGVYYAWALVVAGQVDLAERRLQDARRALDVGDWPEADRDDVEGIIACVRAVAGDGPQETIAFARLALEHLSDRRPTWQGHAHLSLGLGYQSLGQVRAAHAALTRALAFSQAVRNTYATLFATSNLGQVLIAQASSTPPRAPTRRPCPLRRPREPPAPAMPSSAGPMSGWGSSPASGTTSTRPPATWSRDWAHRSRSATRAAGRRAC